MKIQILIIILIALPLITENPLYVEARCVPSDKPCLGPPIPVSFMGKQDSLEHAKALTGMWWVSLPSRVPSNLIPTSIWVKNDPPCCAQITAVYLPPGITISDNDTNYNFVNSGGFSILYLKQEGGPTANLTKQMEIITTGPCYGVEPCPSVITENTENMSSEAHPHLTAINNRLAMVSFSQIDINAGNCMGKVNCWLQIFVGSFKYNSTDLMPIAQSIPISSPLEQFKSGAAIRDILCVTGFVLVTNAEDGSPACVQRETAQKLVERGWGTIPDSSTQQLLRTINSAPAIKLYLRTNATEINSGQAIGIKISVNNTLSVPLNMTSQNNWSYPSMEIFPCGSISLMNIAILTGYFTGANMTEGRSGDLNKYPISCATAIEGTPISYEFQPGSAQVTEIRCAQIQPNANCVPRTHQATAHYELSGFEGNSVAFSPGTYTIIAGDEWGHFAIGHFTVVNSTSS